MKTTRLQHQIALTLLDGIGYKRAKNLIAYTGSVEDIFTAKKSALTKIPGINLGIINSWNKKEALLRAEKEIKEIEKRNITPLFYLDKEFPRRLKNCVDAPLLVYSKGAMNHNATKSIAIVGTRKITEYGKSILDELFQSFHGLDIQIVSGMAYGVDIFAHRKALEHNLETIGVMAHGLDRIYPAMHKQSALRMMENGGLLTEYLTETNPDRENFPMRNRIVAGMTDATIVIESGERGGSLITAELANDYNRDVFAYPGNVFQEYSKGCNKLIKFDKANLVRNGAEIIQMLGWEEKKNVDAVQTQMFQELNSDEQTVVDLLYSENELTLDVLSMKLEKPVSMLSSLLLNLEFSGVVRSLPGKKYRLVAN